MMRETMGIQGTLCVEFDDHSHLLFQGKEPL